MSILLHKPYQVKWSTKGKVVKKVQNSVHMVYEWPLTQLYCYVHGAIRIFYWFFFMFYPLPFDYSDCIRGGISDFIRLIRSYLSTKDTFETTL